MSYRSITLLTVYIVMLAIGLSAQQKEINFSSLTTEDGLSSNTVNTILKDRFGMIWFGTEDGLDRFDGTRFTIYRHRPDDSASLRSNEILSLHEDKAGNFWVGTSGGSLSLYNRKTDAFINFPSYPSSNAIHNNVIRSVCSDHRGKIWVAHYDGVNILDPLSGQVTELPVPAEFGKVFNKIGMCLFEDSFENMWIGTAQGLFKYSFATKAVVAYAHADNDGGSLSGNLVNAITQDKTGALWVGTDKGLARLEPGAQHFVNFTHNDRNPRSLSSSYINSIAADGDKLWIGTSEGLNTVDLKGNIISTCKPDDRDIHSLSASTVKCIYIDKQGIYWVGTVRGGVDKYDKNLNLFNYVRSNAFDAKGLNAPVVTSFAENADGKVFVGTTDKGVSLFDPVTRLFQHLDIRTAGDRSAISPMTMLMLPGKQLLIGTLADGLFTMDVSSRRYKQIARGTGLNELNSNEIYSVAALRNGNMLVGTNGEGINVLDKNCQVIVRYTPHPKLSNDVLLPFNGYIRDMKEDKEGNIWIATHGGGLGVLRKSSGQFTCFNTRNSKLPNDKVECLLEDASGFIWAGTFGSGIARIDINTNRFELFSEKDGLQNNTIYKILEDQSKLIWVSTNKGISRIDVNTKQINNFNYHNGLQHNNFVCGAGIRLTDGKLFFGGLDGFNYFYPSYLIKNNNIPPVLLTGLRVANQYVNPSNDGPIKENISVAKEINLGYRQNFALDYVAVSYTAPEQNRYAYKLDGFDKDWNYAGNITSAAYTNLDPGDYVFRVRAANNDGVWNENGVSINVHVRPPFWRTTYAYVLYLLMACGSLFYMRRTAIRKLQRKFAVQQQKNNDEQAKREAERIHELDSQKIKFLTNLSHEFRTPISLILGPVDNLIEKENNIQSFRQLDMIKRNGRRLLNLVNQLLDFRKMEEHELKLHLSEGELVSFIKDVGDSFKDLAERKQMDFIYSSEIDKLNVLFDHDKLERVLFNVLSNAFKFTRPGGKIMLDIKRTDKNTSGLTTLVAIRISDTGIGIPADQQQKIFDLFYQNDTEAFVLNQGSGIGLTITKEFVKMHGGTISIESEPGFGTAFSILLPLTNCTLPGANSASAPIVSSDAVSNDDITAEKPGDISIEPGESSILLVEDNDDFRYYLKELLQRNYRVLEATNGVEGWKKALSQHPQLIVSDISMPEMNGIDLCRKIKADKRTNHIPVVLLTALAGEEAQLQGLRTGANDYITKPFHIELLNEKIKNLLVLNNTLRDTYSKQFKLAVPEVKVQSADEELLHSIMVYLEENLSNPQLSVTELSKHAGMSRSSLYAKLLELTGQTPVEYIRSVKLDKAAVLLRNTDMNIAQIAYSVGFSTPNYFAKSFKARFNQLPSEYVAKMRMERKNNGTA